ncbi:MAG: helix-turn-helix transcriptional regulator [Roseivirga sp.]|nr:helix-turn-helix transcriptional regulator [Roseivirga sp.]
MPDSIFKTKSVNEIHESLGLDKPAHPLITVIDMSKLTCEEERVGSRITSDLYCIALKDANCALDYGRNHYDQAEGMLLFTAPDQVITLTRAHGLNEINGWLLYFHPDLIRNTPLGDRIEDYSFFGYDTHEALHLSEHEEVTMNHCVGLIQMEINERIDNHSQRVIVSNIELLLNYSIRFYERQFNTRTAQNKDLISKVESLLKDWYKSGQLVESGPPTIKYLADECHLSASYLSDVLKKETGRTTKDHINDFLVDKAKNLLLSSSESISGIAYNLGFNYPHYFSRLFKNKTGMTPQEYREVN